MAGFLLLFPNWKEIKFLRLIQRAVGKQHIGFSFLSGQLYINVFIRIRDHSYMNYLGFLYIDFI